MIDPIEARRMLDAPRISVISRPSSATADRELRQIESLIEHHALVDGRVELETLLGHLIACNAEPRLRTLDLIGHSSPGRSQLTLGDWVIDDTRSQVTAFFRGIADAEMLPQLGVTAVRLLGCTTAVTPQGRATVCALADLLGIEVYGTTGLVYSAHYDSGGFGDEWRFMLASSSDLRSEQIAAVGAKASQRYPRTLDIDALPTTAIDADLRSWPRLIAGSEVARSMLRLIRRGEGATMPGLLATPSCEIALPSSSDLSVHHIAQVLLDGAFIRVYPDGDDQAGVMFPVDDAGAMSALVADLPQATAE